MASLNLRVIPLSFQRASGLVEESMKEQVVLNLEPWGEGDRANAIKALRSYGPRRMTNTSAGRDYFRLVAERNSNPWILLDNRALIPPTPPPNVVPPAPPARGILSLPSPPRLADALLDKQPYKAIIQGPPSSINIPLQPSSRINIISPPQTAASAGPSRTKTSISGARTKVERPARRATAAKQRRASTPDPSRTPPRQYWRFGLGDNQRRRSESSAVTRVVHKSHKHPIAHEKGKAHHKCDICDNISYVVREKAQISEI
ncbi:hypothetical protein B0H13DRAFT_1873966 [Mycena leptocephala]|nr:hypothetical protein B0H13DRAFT_1873966 [Mycena leptocephala]